MSNQSTTLYAPDGRKYVASGRAEVTRLVAQGYSEKRPKSPTASASKPPAKRAAKKTASPRAKKPEPAVDAPKS